MDRESYENMVVNFRAEEKRLKDTIEQAVKAEQEAKKRHQQDAHTQRMLDATRSPIFDEPDRRRTVVQQTKEGIEAEREAQRTEYQSQVDTIYTERREMLEELYWREFGGSEQAALELVSQNEKETEASASLNKAWDHEKDTQSHYDAARSPREQGGSDGLTQTFNDQGREP